jgi:hypothetical protein
MVEHREAGPGRQAVLEAMLTAHTADTEHLYIEGKFGNRVLYSKCSVCAVCAVQRSGFVIRLRPQPGVDAVRALRQALKVLLRRQHQGG